MEQCLFDELVLFLLETVSSQEYLTSIGIYRPAQITWETFKKKVATQKVDPGIYPRNYGRGVAHYYAVRREQNVMKVANGYSSKGGLDSRFAVGLDVQKDRSHGLCQIYALMFYYNSEHLLTSGKDNYFENVLVGLNYLRDFIHEDYYEREREWTPKDILQHMTILCDDYNKERIKNIRKIKSMTDIINIILDPENRDKLLTWFEE